MQGAIAPDGRLIMLGRYLNIWNAVPADSVRRPDLIVNGYDFRGGDGGAVVLAGGRTYVLMYNANKVVGFNQVPGGPGRQPDFTIGAPDAGTNTLLTDFITTNPVPASDGLRLFISSDFDRRLLVWTNVPNASAAKPNIVYDLSFAPWDNELFRTTLVLAGGRYVVAWRRLPLDAEFPDLAYLNRIGNVQFQDIRGVALDEKHFYLADQTAGRVHVWSGLPDAAANPQFSLSVDKPSRLSSDGTWLAVTSTENHRVTVYEVAKLSASAQGTVVGGPGVFNLPQGAAVFNSGLYVANTNFNGLYAWLSISDALAGRPSTIILGTNHGAAGAPAIGAATLFWPGAPSFDGSYLWLGEFKFSQRMLRFAVH